MNRFVFMLLQDNKLQEKLKRDGFIVIPFLNEEEVKNLNEFYNSLHAGNEPPDFIDDIHMTIWCADHAYKEKVSNTLMKLFDAASARYFKHVRRLNNVFIIKRAGQQTAFKVHQDWNVVDETKYESVNVWVPLHNVDTNTGALWVLKGSHRINRVVRGAGYLFPDYTHYLDKLEEKAVSVKLKAGEAIVFYHSVIHGSPPNLGEGLRKAACFTVVPEKAPLCIYYQEAAEKPLQMHQPPDDFMFNYTHLRSESIMRPPSDKAVETLAPYENRKVTEEELRPLFRHGKGVFTFFKGFK